MLHRVQPRHAHDRRDEVVFVDVREPHEWHAGHIEGAEHLPLGQLTSRVGQLDPDREHVLVCRTGARSGQATRFLRGQRIHARNMTGGMVAWAHAGLPLTTASGDRGRVA